MKAKLYASMENYAAIVRWGDRFFLGYLTEPIGDGIVVRDVERLVPVQVASLMFKAPYKRERDQLLKVPDSWKKLEPKQPDFEPAKFIKILNSIKPSKK